ncbi:MAG: M23 family metallopeptidase [Rickettsiales bacterium]|nr:M23 family metallopeptidase [Rickettsiales bacterium]
MLLAWVTASNSHAMPTGTNTFFPLNQKAMKSRIVKAEPYESKKVEVTPLKATGFMPLNRSHMKGLSAPKAVARFRESNAKKSKRLRDRGIETDENEETETAGRFVNSDQMVLELFGKEQVEDEHPFAHAVKGLEHRWPISGAIRQRISSEFGERADPFTGLKDFHEGVDIAAERGTPVRSSAKGRVIGVGKHVRLGNYVKVDHGGGITTQYGHLKDIHVKGGQEVRAGQKVGTVGSTGRSTGPHLDYSLRIDGKPVDPLTRLQIPAKLKSVAFSSIIP